ncbi:MAG: 50S ribosomal protein L31 [Alphaproteobacteria bacterium]|nr:50S ribosomal protein L31 [Alphaproteobacteria bacterium]NDC56379.1 50S ribosomal protein L31 [Alphaproteobacteria bacterium]
MKKEGHPDYHEIKVIMTDGTEFMTRSTWGKPGDTMRLDIDPLTHPAWTGKHQVLERGGQLAKFNKRFTQAPAAKKAADGADDGEKIKLTGKVAAKKK